MSIVRTFSNLSERMYARRRSFAWPEHRSRKQPCEDVEFGRTRFKFRPFSAYHFFLRRLKIVDPQSDGFRENHPDPDATYEEQSASVSTPVPGLQRAIDARQISAETSTFD